MKGFFIEITNNLLEPKHREAMKEAVWLFMWYLDKITSIDENGIGKVLGGKPIKYKDIKEDLGISARTHIYWNERLKQRGYINVVRTPYGCVITVNKARKRFGQRAKSCISSSANSCVSRVKPCVSNIDKTVRQNNIDKTDNDDNNKKNKIFSLRNGLNELKIKMKMPQI